jgi:hypothetical protein
MSIADEVATLLSANTALMALLTGGVHSAAEISRQLTPTAFNAEGEIKPCALVKTPSESAAGPYTDSVQGSVNIYLYERSGYTSVDAAETIVFNLLNKTKVGSHTWELTFDTVNYQQIDFALQCSMVISRYLIVRRKV